jgi:hypothetical protein
MGSMGGEFHRLVMVAMAAGLLVIPGCGAADGSGQGAPQEQTAVAAAAQTKIVSAQLEGTTALRVTYSDDVKPVTGVDPGKFRLTVAYYTRPASASSKYSYGYYAKGGSYAKGSYNKAGYGYGAPQHTVYSDVANIEALANDKVAANETVLQLGSTFDAATACQEIKAFNAANPNAQAGLYLHYTEAGSPTVEDQHGNPVASLAAFWSADPTVEQISGDFTGKPIPVALTCP